MGDRSAGEAIGAHEARLNAHDKLIEKLETKLDKIFYAVIIFAITQIAVAYSSAPPDSAIVAFINNLKP